MGVQGLWDLLAPVGRRVSVETLAGKRLAIDASIWMVQFMKAMRDERGEMVRNAHLLGFFRRICKLLYLRSKPVFVFDGGTPALKRRTVIARRRQRENAQAKIRKTAEKLLLNHLKAMRLEDLAKDHEKQRKNQKNDGKGKKIATEQAHSQDSYINQEHNVEYTGAEINNQKNVDEMLAASLAYEEDRHLNNNGSTATVVPDAEQSDSEENEDIMWPAMDGRVDPTVLASLPKAMQLDFMRRNRSTMDNGKNKEVKDGEQNDNAKGKEVLSDQIDMLERDNVKAKSYNQEELDEMLAACMAAEERQSLTKIASTSGAPIPLNLDGDDEDEEMILPAFSGKVDPAILAALPPSMQLDLLVQMRERLMAENRQKYQKVKKAPEKFSELQIEAYLKTVNFRREINQVQRAAAGKDVGGVQTSRIASEANKEFIFSSSFTGDKQLLTSAGVQRNGENSSNSVDQIASTSKSTTVTAFVQDESGRVFDEDVETYVDEMGRVRVSRVRAMGMRMTRDLQRNLDLMKDIELERTPPTKTASARPELLGHEIGSQKSIPSKEHDAELSHDNNASSVKLNDRNVHSILNDGSSIQISFEVDCESKHAESDDDIFTSLVAGQPVKISSNSASDSDWEEGIVDRDGGCSKDVTVGTNAFLQESNANDDSEVEWEEEGCDVHENYKPTRELGKTVSKGDLVEESDLQEAIRRSLEDFRGEDICDRRSSEVTHRDVKFLDSKDNTGKINLLEEDRNRQNKSFGEIMATAKHDGLSTNDNLHLCSSSRRKMHISESHDTDNQGILISQLSPPDLDLDDGQPTKTLGNSAVKDHSSDSIEDKEIAMSVDRPMDTSSEDVKKCPGDVSVLNAVSSEMNFSTSVDNDDNNMKIDLSALSNEKKIPEATFHVVELTKDSRTPVEPVLEGEKNAVQSNENEHFMDKFSNNENEQCMDKFSNNENLQPDFSEADLQEEILSLNQERITLGREQKKLERNAESVSSEMFAECQELLQMFGIPYIIAPMEAEAQCAYMELANLVDGVVTDDSDVFLFGGQSVYKNIFDDRKYVETYLMKDVEKELGLTREKLVRMALLLGSDYTEGISGIGIVNAIEVVNAFPEEDGLQKFREWIESPDPNILGKFYANSQACGQESSSDHSQEMKQIFMKQHRNVSKNWHVPSSFPSEAVISAYFCPQVDKSTDPFTWGKPDIHVLRKHCWDKFGWAAQKSDELLMPVLKEYTKHETQLRLEAFYSFNERFAKIRSKRIKKAVKGITGNHLSEVMDDSVEGSSRSRKKRTNVSGESGDVTEKPSKRGKRSACSLQTDSLGKTTEKQSRKIKTGGSVSSDVENREKSQQLNTDCERGKGRGGGHRRVRGRGRGRRGRGKGKESFDVEQCDSSSVESSSGDDNVEVCVEKPEASKELRRSTRTRKAANYVQNDTDIDDVDKSLDLNSKMSGKEAIEQSGSVTVEGAGNNTSKSQNSQEHHNINGPLPEEDISRDYLEMGGGFVNEEDESGKGLDNYPGSTEDYLKMGGSFCLNESEAAVEQDPADATCFYSLMEQDDSVKNPDQETLCEDLGKRISSDANSGLDCSTTGNVSLPKDTESNNAMPSLSAMPFLKRKRRKS